MASIFERDLDRNAANYQPLTPISFLERAAKTFPDHTAIIHGEQIEPLAAQVASKPLHRGWINGPLEGCPLHPPIRLQRQRRRPKDLLRPGFVAQVPGYADASGKRVPALPRQTEIDVALKPVAHAQVDA